MKTLDLIGILIIVTLFVISRAVWHQMPLWGKVAVIPVGMIAYFFMLDKLNQYD